MEDSTQSKPEEGKEDAPPAEQAEGEGAPAEEGEPKEVIRGSDIKTNWFESIDTFEDLELHPDLLRGIYGYGYEQPSQIQQKGILPIIKGKDTIAQA